MSFSGRKTYRLGEIATFYNGRAYKNEEFLLTGTPIVRIQNLTGEGKTVFSDLNLEPNKYIDKGDLIYAWSATFGPYLWKGEKSIYHYHIWKIECKENLLDKYYFYYTLKHISDRLKSGGNGTLFVHITKGFMESFEIDIPNISIQRKTASILSSLDDAIELNQQINKTLEEMAKAIFKEWFVDFNFPNATGKFQETEIGKIPFDWKVATFEDFFDADRGLSYKGAGLALAESEATPMHNLNSVLEGGGYKTIGIKYYNGEYKDKHIVNAGEVIVANTEQGHKYMLIGYPAIVPQFYGEHGIFSHHIYRIRPKANCYLSPDFIFHLLLQPQVRDQVVGFANGTTVNMLKIEGLKKPKFAMPPKELAEKFGAIAKANRLQAEQNIEENQSLINLRDTLLPKLMKGEIELSEK